VFRSIKQSDEVSEWFKTALRQWNANHRIGSQEHTGLLQKELTQLRLQQDKLLNLRLADEIDADAFAMKKTELRDRIANTTLQMEVVDRDRGEQGELAIKTFELSQALEQKWFIAGFAEKRKLLELVFSNFRLDGVSLCYEINKPFDILAKGLSVPSDRGDKIRTCDLLVPNQALYQAELHPVGVFATAGKAIVALSGIKNKGCKIRVWIVTVGPVLERARCGRRIPRQLIFMESFSLHWKHRC
jgi:hypothetical protein